jgi:phosphoribosylaminoimidazole-succinocarboxamide synthase
LTKEGLKGKDRVEMTEAVVNETAKKYREAFELLTGQKWDEVIKSSGSA